jgi:transmembrane sensor
MQAPLKQYLRVDDEPALQRSWREIEARLDGPPVRSRRPLVLGLGSAFAAAAVALVLVMRGGSPTPTPGALALSSGGAMPAVVSAPIAMADGSSIDVTGGQLEVMENDADSVHMVLPRGRAKFAITPGGPRTWTIDTGIAEVRVVGTELAVDREAHAVTVSVTRGVVEVRSPHLATYRRLVAGEFIRLTDDLPVVPRTASNDAPSAAVAAIPSTTAPATTANPSAALSATDTVATNETVAGTPATASKVAEQPSTNPSAKQSAKSSTSANPATASPATSNASTANPSTANPSTANPSTNSGVTDRPSTDHATTGPSTNVPATAKALLARADEQRRNGAINAAIDTLARTSTMPTDDSTGLAWFTRAKLLAQLGRTSEAITDFERALAAGLPTELAARAQERIDELRPSTR